MNQKNAPKLPTKWLVVLVFALVAYGLGQPLANRKLGWHLPSLASLLGYQDTATPESTEKQTAAEKLAANSAADKLKPAETEAEESLPANNSTADKASEKSKSTNQPNSDPSKVQGSSQNKAKESAAGESAAGESAGGESAAGRSNSAVKPADRPADKSSAKPPQANKEDLLYGLLKETGREDYISPAGLRFTRGSEEGHRLKHLERHLEDQPDRPGKHGVFYGDMPQVVKWLDEAYSRASTGAKGTTKREEDGRTVYEVNFSKPIGYIGGRDGARQKNPDSKRLRMVVDDNRLITAFPF